MDSFILPDTLKEARLSVEGITEIKVLEDFYWINRIKLWCQKIEINIGTSSNPDFPEKTIWYITCADNYPEGNIQVWPAKINGIEDTFHHQEYVEDNDSAIPWKSGHLCLSNELTSVISRGDYLREPKTIRRVEWYYRRAVDWCVKVANNEFAKKGERFELPATTNKIIERTNCVVIRETEQSFSDWKKIVTNAGFIKGKPELEEGFFHLNQFTDFSHDTVLQYEWNTNRNKSFKENIGIWFKLDSVPVIRAWQIPRTWDELDFLLSNNGINLVGIINKHLIQLNTKKPFLISLGFPIPRKVGDSAELIWWYFIRVPAIEDRKINGFREKSLRKLMAATFNYYIFEKRKIDWLHTKNVDRERIFSRGSFTPTFKKSKILLVGVGAVGSAVVELLARGGCEHIEIVDFDAFDISNLSRHTLTFENIFKFKTTELSKRLHNINPFLKLNIAHPNFNSYNPDEIEKFDIIIDCTGDDNVIELLGKISNKEKFVVSISLGFEALKSYLAMSWGWNKDKFFEKFSESIKLDIKKMESGLPEEGIGCWHYAFPADAADVWSHVSIAVKVINQYYDAKKTDFMIFEKQFVSSVYSGVKGNTV